MITKAIVQSVQDLRHKRDRDERNHFIAEGPKAVREFLTAPNVKLHQLFATEEWFAQAPPLPSQRFLEPITNHELKRLSNQETPNQVVAVFEKPTFSTSPNYKNQITLALDTIQDPGNLGTIIRCADWFDVRHILCSPQCADAFNPKVVQATMGSLARIQITICDLEAEIRSNPQIPVYATALTGQSIHQLKPANEAILIIGNESRGVSNQLLSLATTPITIPRAGQAESLNAAIATGIILSHIIRPASR